MLVEGFYRVQGLGENWDVADEFAKVSSAKPRRHCRKPSRREDRLFWWLASPVPNREVFMRFADILVLPQPGKEPGA